MIVNWLLFVATLQSLVSILESFTLVKNHCENRFRLTRTSRTTLLLSSSTTESNENKNFITNHSPPSSSTAPAFVYSPLSLLHIQNVDLPPDYSRPWTQQKTIATVGALVVGGVMGALGEVAIQSVFHQEKAFVFLGAIGAAVGWQLLGGQEITKSEAQINGGLDAKLIADKPSRINTTIAFLNQQQQKDEPTNVHVIEKRHDENEILKHILKVHDAAYVEKLKQSSLSDNPYPHRLYPTYTRTLVDQHSYHAALQAVGDWMECVKDASQSIPPSFLLVRPPSHHACKAKAKGGCLLNSIAIAAKYALDELNGIHRVAILDIDAHHGNGIAHCIQDDDRIRYCSIHEEYNTNQLLTKHQALYTDSMETNHNINGDDDPRSPSADDTGPLDNILNINLPHNTGWRDGYAEALETKAMPFLCRNFKPDVLLVAAGFDALEEDWSSSLRLQPEDYAKLGTILKQYFGNRIAFGLEGGYAYKEGQLANAITEFIKPWQS